MKSLLKAISLRCVQSANSGLRKIKDAIIWPVDVDTNFAMFVEESICNANVLKNKDNSNWNFKDNNNYVWNNREKEKVRSRKQEEAENDFNN